MVKNASAGRDGTYSDIAGEYYDPYRHPTSANFRYASKRLVSEAVLGTNLKGRWICDVGCGASVLGEILQAQGQSVEHLLLLDSSEAMLRHSTLWREHGATLAICDAHHLCVGKHSISVLVASLGDPFNDPVFWSEAFRVIAPGGLVIYTGPSHEWAAAFRSRTHSPFHAAEFVSSLGDLRVPSIIPTRSAQLEMMVSAGFSIVGTREFRRSELASATLSPKIVDVLPTDISVVSCFVGVKQDT